MHTTKRHRHYQRIAFYQVFCRLTICRIRMLYPWGPVNQWVSLLQACKNMHLPIGCSKQAVALSARQVA